DVAADRTRSAAARRGIGRVRGEVLVLVPPGRLAGVSVGERGQGEGEHCSSDSDGHLGPPGAVHLHRPPPSAKSPGPPLTRTRSPARLYALSDRDVLPPAALAARRCAPAAGRAALRRTRGAPARLARAFRLTLAATSLVHRGRRDPLRRPAAAAAALRAALDLLVLPFALVAPGARHPPPPRLTGGAKAGKLGTAWRGATFGGAGPRSLRAAEASAGDGTERQGAQLDGRGEREQRRCASELLVRRTRQPVPGGIAGAEDQRREERLPGGAKPDRHEAPHRLDGARPPQSERQRMEELQEHERGGPVRARDEPPTQRGPRTGGAQQRRQVESPEQRRERPQSGD